jgi:hypothetical protein
MTSEPSSARDFFDIYAEVSMAGDAERLAGFYAPVFIVAGPKGSASFPNDGDFLRWLRGVFAFNRRSGMQSMQVVNVREHRISDTHATFTVTWGTRFAKTGDRVVEFDITYLLEDAGSGRKILAYVAHTDQEEEMRRLGVLPEPEAGAT